MVGRDVPARRHISPLRPCVRYDCAKWVLERVESFPKNQRHVPGRRLSEQVMAVLEILVEAASIREKRDLLAGANRKIKRILRIQGFGVKDF